jgi:hypothetical protein
MTKPIVSLLHTEDPTASYLQDYETHQGACGVVLAFARNWAVAIVQRDGRINRFTFARNLGSKGEPAITVYEDIALVPKQIHRRMVLHMQAKQHKYKKQLHAHGPLAVFEAVLQYLNLKSK